MNISNTYIHNVNNEFEENLNTLDLESKINLVNPVIYVILRLKIGSTDMVKTC